MFFERNDIWEGKSSVVELLLACGTVSVHWPAPCRVFRTQAELNPSCVPLKRVLLLSGGFIESDQGNGRSGGSQR
jgi:hypothetical protein